MTFEIPVDAKTVLRLRSNEDAESIFALVDHDRAHLRPWFPWVDATHSPKDTEAYIAGCREGFEKKTSADFGILYEGKWVGSLGFHEIDRTNHKGEIGYWIGQDYQGKGIVTACVRAIVPYGFLEQNLHRIAIKCVPANTRSRSVPERLGFVLEGTLREEHLLHGVYEDTLVFGLLKQDWEQRSAATPA